LRKLLKDRIAAIRNAMIREVLIPSEEDIYRRFISQHPKLAPRHQRDFPRILALIKASALWNFAHRKRPEGNDRTIIANKEDEEEAFKLYRVIAESNELGLAPEVYEVYTQVLKPLLKEMQLVTRQQVLNAYFRHYGRFLNEERLRREVLPPLEAKGLIVQEPDPVDRRRMLIALSELEIGGVSVYGGPEPLGESQTPHISQTSPIFPQPYTDLAPISQRPKNEGEKGATALEGT